MNCGSSELKDIARQLNLYRPIYVNGVLNSITMRIWMVIVVFTLYYFYHCNDLL